MIFGNLSVECYSPKGMASLAPLHRYISYPHVLQQISVVSNNKILGNVNVIQDDLEAKAFLQLTSKAR